MEQTRRNGRVTTSAALLMLVTAAGCSPAPDQRDRRLAEFARQSMEQQAKQNEHIARNSKAMIEENQKLVEATRELVAHDAQARQELIAAQERLTTQLNQQQASIAAGRDQLEQDRRQIAEQRFRDPILAAAIQNAGLLIACTLPLIVCIFVIKRMSSREPDDAAVAELLVYELTSDRPRLLPGPSLRPPALEHQADRVERSDSSASDQPAESDLPS
jgi:hypothetical protein